MRIFEVYQSSLGSDPIKLRWVNRLVTKLSGSMDKAFTSGQLELPKLPEQPGAATTPTAPTASTTTPAAPSQPKTPEQVRQEKLAAATQTARQQMGATPTTPAAPSQPKTPEQVRQEKLAAATQTARQQMGASKTPPNVLKEQSSGKISDYIFNYITKFVGGKLKDSKQETNIRNLADKIEQVYSTTQDKKEINSLLRTISGVAYDSLVKKTQSSLGSTGSGGQSTSQPMSSAAEPTLDIRKIVAAVKNLDVGSLKELKKEVEKQLQTKKSSQPV